MNNNVNVGYEDIDINKLFKVKEISRKKKEKCSIIQRTQLVGYEKVLIFTEERKQLETIMINN